LLVALLLLPGWATAALNDTGITQCANATQNNLPCPQAGFPSQDAETGRDAQTDLQKIGGGSAGFDFTKLDAGGNPLPASASAWDCVHDNVTGLVWEIKTDDNGLRDKDWEYTWYNADPATNGGDAGTMAATGALIGDGLDGAVRLVRGGQPLALETTPTSDFTLDDVNGTAYHKTTGLTWKRCAEGQSWDSVNKTCAGMTTFYTWLAALRLSSGGWHLPNYFELSSIVERRRTAYPAINTTVFPNTSTLYYFWSASTLADDPWRAWAVIFDSGSAYPFSKFDRKLGVRLVRGGQGLAGDVNGDGSVNALDVVAVINAVLGIQPLPAADVNDDGATNALDVVFVINQVLGLSP